MKRYNKIDSITQNIGWVMLLINSLLLIYQNNVVIKQQALIQQQAEIIRHYDGKILLTPQQLCQDYYHKPCTENGELP